MSGIIMATPHCYSVFQDLEHVIRATFLPALYLNGDFFWGTRSVCSSLEHGWSIQLLWAVHEFSVHSTAVLMRSILYICHGVWVRWSYWDCTCYADQIPSSSTHEWYFIFAEHFNSLLPSFDLHICRQDAILRAKECNFLIGCFTIWKQDQFDLSAQQFCDGLALCYRKPLFCLPSNCDGSGAPFTVTHALDYHVSGLVGRRHNEVRDAFGDLAFLVWA